MSTVLVCEPQCIGFEHAEFNAALLRTAELAFPGSRVLFAGEPDHVSRVRARLGERGASGSARIEWAEIDVPRRYRSRWKRYAWPRLRSERLWCAQVRSLAQAQGAALVLIASVGPLGLLRWSQAASESDPRTLAFLHGVMAHAYEEKGIRRLKAQALRSIFHFRKRERFRYVALGDSILTVLREVDPGLAERFTAMDMPTLWADQPLTVAAAGKEALRFGYFGVSAKGFDTFTQVATRVRAEGGNARFSLVGFLNDRPLAGQRVDIVEGLTTAPLTADEYALRARSVAYAVWTASPRPYRLTASASFVDAVAFGKPSIALRNPFVQHYFDLLGDIGYLCDSVDEMADTMGSIVREFPAERYRRQCGNLARGRGRFAPAAAAIRLAAIASDFSPP